MNEPQCLFFAVHLFFRNVDRQNVYRTQFHFTETPCQKHSLRAQKKNILAVCKLQIGKQHAEYVNRRNSK